MHNQEEVIGKLVFVDVGTELKPRWLPGCVVKEIISGLYKIHWFDSDAWGEWSEASVQRGYFSRFEGRTFDYNSL